MPPSIIRFDDGAAYEDYMGPWSRAVGEVFLRWLAPSPGGRWLDVGCGNGVFTELLLERSAPAAVDGIDPAEAQIAYARGRLADARARFRTGDAMGLPYDDAAFDAAVMALVIFFVPDPARAVAEMVRVVRPGGSVSSYAWDLTGGGMPYEAVQQEMTALGAPPVAPPSIDASRLETMATLWSQAGLVDIATRRIAVTRTFPDFDAFWAIAATGPRLAPALAAMTADETETLRRRLRARLPTHADGRIAYAATANAVRGRRTSASPTSLP